MCQTKHKYDMSPARDGTTILQSNKYAIARSRDGTTILYSNKYDIPPCLVMALQYCNQINMLYYGCVDFVHVCCYCYY